MAGPNQDPDIVTVHRGKKETTLNGLDLSKGCSQSVENGVRVIRGRNSESCDASEEKKSGVTVHHGTKKK